MTSLCDHKTKVMAVFNRCTESTIPFENFLNVNADKFEKHILSFYQHNDEVENHISTPALKKGATLHGLDANRPLGLISIYRLFAIILKIKPDIIHIHHNISGLAASIMALPFRRTKIMTTIHNNFEFFNRRQKIIFILTYILSDMIVCNSFNTRNRINKIKKRFFPKTPTIVIYNGIDIKRINDAFEKTELAPSEASGTYSIGTVGRLVTQKDHRTLIRAFALFHKQISQSVLTLIGDGKLRKQLEQLTRELGIRKQVIFCGIIPRDKTYHQLRSFDLFIISSRWEGFCNAMVEAMATGIPVLASNIQPLPEVLGPGNGRFFTAGDINDLYKNMIYCYNNRDELKELGNKAHKYASAQYSLTTSVSNYESAYKSLARS